MKYYAETFSESMCKHYEELCGDIKQAGLRVVGIGDDTAAEISAGAG